MGLEHKQRKIIPFPTKLTKVPVESGENKVLTPEEVGTIIIYRYYDEVGNTYPVVDTVSRNFLQYVQLLARVYSLEFIDGQPDSKGRVKEKFLFESSAPSPEIAPSERFCAVLQMKEGEHVSAVSFRMLPNKPSGNVLATRSRLKILK